jgi:hypothetical protein
MGNKTFSRYKKQILLIVHVNGLLGFHTIIAKRIFRYDIALFFLDNISDIIYTQLLFEKIKNYLQKMYHLMNIIYVLLEIFR